MPEMNFAPLMESPLHGFGLAAKAKPADESCGVWANEVPLHGYISLRGSSAEQTFIGIVSGIIGTQLPPNPCTFSEANGVMALWLSPDEWLIIAPRTRVPVLVREMGSALAGIRHQAADNSGGFTKVVLSGRNAKDVLSHCIVYDLAKLGAGRVVGSTFGKSSVYMYRQGSTYYLLFRRSFADYIWRYLVRAAEPYGFGIMALPAGGAA